jgi:hypothetical protein
MKRENKYREQPLTIWNIWTITHTTYPNTVYFLLTKTLVLTSPQPEEAKLGDQRLESELQHGELYRIERLNFNVALCLEYGFHLVVGIGFEPLFSSGGYQKDILMCKHQSVDRYMWSIYFEYVHVWQTSKELPYTPLQQSEPYTGRLAVGTFPNMSLAASSTDPRIESNWL